MEVIRVDANRDYPDWVDVTGVALGEASITATVTVEGQERVLSIPAEVSLPEWGFYTVPAVDLDHRVQGEVTYGSEEDQYTTIYLVRNGGIPAASTTGQGEDVPYIAMDGERSDGESAYLTRYGQWKETQDGSGVYYLQISLPQPEEKQGSYDLHVFVPGTPGVCGGYGEGVLVCLPGQAGGNEPGPGPGPGEPQWPATPCLYMRDAAFEGEWGHQEFAGAAGPAQFEVTAQPGYNWDRVIFCHTESQELPLSSPDVTVAVEDTALVALEDRGPYFRMRFLKVGETRLTVTLTLEGEETTLTLPIRVEMPAHGFFVKPENSEVPVYDKDYLVSHYEFGPMEEDVTFYVMGTEPLSDALYVVVDMWPEDMILDGREIRGVEGVEYCYAVTLPGPEMGNEFYATAWMSAQEDPAWLADMKLSRWSDEMQGQWWLTLSDGSEYSLELGERGWDGRMWPVNPQSCRLPGAATQLDLPFLLWCRDRNEEASQEAYAEFWEKYTLCVTCPDARQYGDVQVSVTGTGADTRVGITAQGPWFAKVMLEAAPKAEGEKINSFTLFRYGEPTYLTDDDGDGVYHIPPMSGQGNDWYAIDLGREMRVNVSAQGAMADDLFGSLNLSMEDGSTMNIWWKNSDPDPDGNDTGSMETQTTARYLLLEFNRWSMGEPDRASTAGADITVTPVLPSLKATTCRVVDGNVFSDNRYTGTIRHLPEEEPVDYLFGYGYPDEVTPLNVTGVRSSDDTVIRAELAQGNDDAAYVRLTFLQEGRVTLSVETGERTYTMEAVCTLPGLAFYSQGRRSVETLLLNGCDYAQLDDGKIYFIAPQELDLSDVEFCRDGEALAGSAWESVTLSGYTCAVITPGAPEEGGSFELAVWEAGEDGMVLLDIRIYDGTPPEPDDPDDAMGSSYGFQYNGQDWRVGFTFTVGDTIIVNEGSWRYGMNVWGEPDPSVQRNMFREMTVAAGIRKQDSGDAMPYYLPDEEDTVGLEVVRMWLEPLRETEECMDCLSWVQDANAAVRTKSGGFTNNVSAALYARPGYAADTRVWARVRISIPGRETVETDVSVVAWLYRTYDYTYERPDGDTLAELQKALDDAAEALDPDIPNQDFTFVLGESVYEGTLVIPEKFNGNNEVSLYINGHDGTTFVGGIDLNGEGQLGGIRDISFIAPAQANNETVTSAIFNGTALNVDCCVFQGYDVALDASYGSIKFAGNVFVNNRIAVRVDLAEHCDGGNISAMEGNSFIKNDVAIQWLTFSPNYIPYYFRIVESNFIGNRLDFDMQSPSTTVYQYRNYYGQDVGGKLLRDLAGYLNDLLDATTVGQINGLVIRRRPQMNVVRGSTVVTNPRWKYPVNNWWHYNRLIGDVFPPTAQTRAALMEDDALYADLNVLVADWEESTIIVNDEAARLILDPSAFDEEGENKLVDVVDREGSVLGSWAFPGTSAQAALLALPEEEETPAAPVGFNAALDIKAGEEDITVTVVDNVVLARHTPTLTVSGGADWENARVVGPDGQVVESTWDTESKSVTFLVVQGGEYRVTSAQAEETPNEPDPTPDPDPKPTPSTPPTNPPSTPSTPPTTSETTTNEDGSVTTIVTDHRTGTVTETVKTPDGTVTETVKNPDGTVIATVTEPNGTVIETVTAPEGDMTLTVTDPEGEVAVTLHLPAQLPALTAEEKFVDVPEDHWAAGAIENMAALGLVKGVSTEEKTYDMESAMSRGALACVLFRFSNGAEGMENAFADVARGEWYSDGVAWAAQNGIVTGYSADAFGPSDTISREQLAVMLYRFAKLIGMDVSADTGALNDFADGGKVDDWAADGVAWCVGNGILRGKSGGMLDPVAPVSRAEAAVMLDRLIGLLGA